MHLLNYSLDLRHVSITKSSHVLKIKIKLNLIGYHCISFYYPSNSKIPIFISWNCESCGVSKMKKQKKTKGLEMQGCPKPDPYYPSHPYVITSKEFQVLLSSITCLPSYLIGIRYLPYFAPTQCTCLI